MKELNFDSGLVTYSLNGKCEITFNPTDSAFVERLFHTFETLDQKQEAYRAEAESIEDPRLVFDIARQRDAEMRAMIDETLGASACSTETPQASAPPSARSMTLATNSHSSSEVIGRRLERSPPSTCSGK